MSRRKNRRKARIIKSTKEFRDIAIDLVKKVNADKQLSLLAALNPILALEELGYEFTDESRIHLERILRFPEKTWKQLESLETEIHKIAGRSFKIDEPAELDKVLFKKLKLNRVKSKPKVQSDFTQPSPTTLQLTSPLKHQIRSKRIKEKIKDPLSELKGSHPIIKPLLAYRKLEASTSRFATRENYEKVKLGKVKLPITEIKFQFRNESLLKRGEK